MSEWKEYKLGDIAEITSSKRIFYSEYVENGVPFYRSKEIIDLFNRRDIQTELFITEKRFKEIEEKFGVPMEDDILLTSVGSLGVPYKVKRKDKFYFKDGNLTWFRNLDKSKVIPDFLFTWISSNVGKQKLDEVSIGSTQAALTISGLKTIEILLPDLKTQKSIASILSCLDNKIDLLHRQNATLEKIAETLFRQWFVEEAKEDWEVKPLGSLVTVKRGGSPRPIQDYLSDTGLRWLKISDATKENSPYVFEIKEHIKVEGLNKTTHLKAGTLVLSNSATPGIPKILQVDTCIHDGWLHFPKSHFSNEFLYLLFKKIRPELLQQGNGSIFTNLKTDILKEYPIPIADNESLLFFDNQVKPIFNKILKNQTQIRTLTALRDTLLPKLMSGEVTVEC
jgi:type I restriction enzyme S subunit